jgi:hypothetical protein
MFFRSIPRSSAASPTENFSFLANCFCIHLGLGFRHRFPLLLSIISSVREISQKKSHGAVTEALWLAVGVITLPENPKDGDLLRGTNYGRLPLLN